MTRPRTLAVACLAVGALVSAGCGADTEPHATPTAAQPSPAPGATTPAPAPPPAAAAPARFRGPLAFNVRRRTQLRTSPGGRVVATMTTRTEFKSPRILAVAGRKPGWVLVRTAVRKHHVGWLPLASGHLFSQRRTDRYRVAIGTDATPTPTGRFAITDRLTVRPGTDYGCCILALTAHQPKIAQGWGGGDRVAIHATPNVSAIGKKVSHGCIRATNAALHRLMRQMRLGAPVTIHA
jgi:L,D-transpeptidase catalytic domain